MTVQIQQNVCGDEQESNFMNACLSIHGKHAISIAVRAPQSIEHFSSSEIEAKFRLDFQHLVDNGYAVEAQVGLNEHPEYDVAKGKE